MREIKFKIWDKEYKRFIASPQGRAHIGISPDGYVVNLQDGDGGPERYELVQFTGLKDKNGTEIYEDDLLGWNNHKYRVYYNQYIAAYGLIAIGNEAAQSYPEFKEAEIIGNALENPELLEEK